MPRWLCRRRRTAHPRRIEFAEQRGGTLYRLDSERKLRFSHENPEVQKAYEEFLGKPLSRTAHKLLHSEHVNELYFETHNYL